mmetsp:Transcript_27466/g.75075  ORF Transcript_27466/g.75075 Transcript_27466/m.75075 type:complete len:616 (-) Transcript_27466:252-2099(-)
MSLQVHTASQNAESRPLPRDRKKLGLFKRWTVSIHQLCLHSSKNNAGINNGSNSSNRNRTHSSGTDSMISSYSSPSLDGLPFSRTSSIDGLLDLSQKHPHYNSNDNKGSIEHMATNCPSCYDHLPQALIVAHGTSPKNIFYWMQTDCPKDVLPLILAFAGPQKIAAIQRTNRFWCRVIQQETTWRQLCEELYKWKEGDVIPCSWKKYYQYNPCVPVDYSTIHSAMNDVVGKAKVDPTEPSAVRVLLRPGRYVLREAITIDERIPGENHAVAIEIETMEYVPENCYNGDHHCHAFSFRQTNKSKRKRKSSLRNFFQCRTVDVEDEGGEEDVLDHENLHEYLNNPSTFSAGRPVILNHVAEDDDSLIESPASRVSSTDDSKRSETNEGKKPVDNRATLVLTTRRHNEPLFRIRQGSCTVRNVDLRHGSHGNDIWNGNAAIQIQPPLGADDDPLDVPAPTATLDCVDVMSSSGRGIVNIDGGHVKIYNSYIHDCAATGVYIGGSGSRVTLDQTDVLFNGKGNKRNRRGIAPGHSGIYVEQGQATITDCNISGNTLTGISVVSPDNALINLRESDLVSNGTFQLELPGVGTVSHGNSVSANNNLASSGIGRIRSGFPVE